MNKDIKYKSATPLKHNRIAKARYKKMQNERSYWNRWYIIVLAVLILEIIIFYLITRSFS